MGGLSLMSVTVMMAVAVLERPKFRLPSMSVACTMMVYWDTFCKKAETEKKNRACGYSSAKSCSLPPVYNNSRRVLLPEEKKVLCSVL